MLFLQVEHGRFKGTSRKYDQFAVLFDGFLYGFLDFFVLCAFWNVIGACNIISTAEVLDTLPGHFIESAIVDVAVYEKCDFCTVRCRCFR